MKIHCVKVYCNYIRYNSTMSFFNFFLFYERIQSKYVIILKMNKNNKKNKFFSNSPGLLLGCFCSSGPSKPLFGSFVNN